MSTRVTLATRKIRIGVPETSTVQADGNSTHPPAIVRDGEDIAADIAIEWLDDAFSLSDPFATRMKVAAGKLAYLGLITAYWQLDLAIRLNKIDVDARDRDNRRAIRTFTLTLPADAAISVDHRLVKAEPNPVAAVGGFHVDLANISDLATPDAINDALGKLACLAMLKAAWEMDLARRRNILPSTVSWSVQPIPWPP